MSHFTRLNRLQDMESSQSHAGQWEGILKRYRPYLVSLAFRMTGSLSDAEDIVQETFVECSRVDPSQISSPKSWLTKVCSNKGLDYLKLAYRKRETYPGVWLPDAIPDSFQILHLPDADSPERSLIDSESLTTSFLLLIERLTPEERVVYLLSDVFDYSFDEIAELLEKSEEACRKMAQRARRSVLSNRPKFEPSSPESARVIASFFDSVKRGDQSALLSLLAEDSELWSDGGGKVPVASTTVLKDRNRIADFFAKIGASSAFHSNDVKLELSWVNSRPGAVISRRLASRLWSFDTILSFEVEDGKIARIYAQRAPEKLKKLEALN